MLRYLTRFFYRRIQTHIHEMPIPDYKRHLFYPTKEIKRMEAIEKRKHWKLQQRCTCRVLQTIEIKLILLQGGCFVQS